MKKRAYRMELFGLLRGEQMDWPDVGEKVGLVVEKGKASHGGRSTPLAVAKEILDAWFSSKTVESGVDEESIEKA